MGGKREQIEDGYYLRASNSNGGTLLGESLPNVKGEFDAYTYSASIASGPFNSRVLNSNAVQEGPNLPWFRYNINLNRGNSVYKDDALVQPKSINVYMWRRTN